MESIELGDITLTLQGDLLRVTIADQQPTATWSVAAAEIAIGWLLTWIVSLDDGQRLSTLLDRTVRELLGE